MPNLKNFLGLLILFLLLSMTEAHSALFSGPSKILASIKTENLEESVNKLRSMDIDIASISQTEKIIDVVISDTEYKLLLNNKMIPDISMVKGVSSFGVDEEYKNPEEIEIILNDFHAKYPSLTKLVSIGKSLEGRDIWALKISDNASVDESVDEPALLFNGMHHAREVMTPEVVLDLAAYLLEGYGTDSNATKWVDGLEVWVLPMLNVDGNNMMWTQDKMWRKNTRGGYGVDLNRNYPVGWNSCDGSSGRASAQDYRGDAPASEPETQVMMNFVKTIRPAFNISYHSYSEIVIYPYGCKPLYPETKEIIEEIGNTVAKKIGYKAGTAWELLYNADGGDIDWMYKTYGVIPFVIELNSRWDGGFHPDYRRNRDKTVKKNRAGWQHLMERALSSGVHGKLDFGFSDYSNIKVHVFQNNKSFMTYPMHANGVFHLTLDAGTYELRFIDDKGNEIQKTEVRFQDKLMNLTITKINE